jgi:hypothetical protein
MSLPKRRGSRLCASEAKAAAQGVLTGNTGGTDKSYSAQRADEIAIELSSARVLLPATGGGVIEQVLRRVF